MSELTPLADAALAAGTRAPAFAPLAFAELASERAHRLPRDHPHHIPDGITLGARARITAERARPWVVKVATFWDHRVRTVPAGTRNLVIDASGSYRVE